MSEANPSENENITSQAPSSLLTLEDEQSTFNDISPTTVPDKGHWSGDNDIRSVAGNALHKLSDLLNDNIIAARYGTFAAIGLLSAYGLAHSPLFFRYKTVADIPTSWFTKRQKIRCRLIRVVDSDTTNTGQHQPIICLVRHLSPTGSLLTRSAFDVFMKASPSAAVGKKLEENISDLMKVEIAGIRRPPFYASSNSQDGPGQWLRRLANDRTAVTCELLARRVHTNQVKVSSDKDPMAVVRLMFRPGGQWFQKDLAESLVSYGRASVSSLVLSTDETTVETSSDIQHLDRDRKYMEKLEKLEYQAVKESRGMWSDSAIRLEQKDLVEEVEFQAKATFFQRLWRKMRG